MAGLGGRLASLAFVALLVVLAAVFVQEILVVLGLLVLVLVLTALLFYVRLRLALRRFRRAFRAAGLYARRRAAEPRVPPGRGSPAGPEAERSGSRTGPDVVDAEFRVKDER